MAKMLKSKGGTTRPPSFFPDAEALAVEVTEPEPGEAVPVLVDPASWDPAPLRPGPVPAPLVIY
jgi:hypothetical protein